MANFVYLKPEEPREFWWRVEVKVPVENSYQTQAFDAKFLMLPGERIEALTEQHAKDEADFEVLRAAWIGWRGIEDAEGNELVFSESLRDQLLKEPAIAFAVSRTYFEVTLGRGAERGN